MKRVIGPQVEYHGIVRPASQEHLAAAWPRIPVTPTPFGATGARAATDGASESGSSAGRRQQHGKEPLQPFACRETACAFLESRTAGRRCIVANGREIGLGYQVAYCFGRAHQSCSFFAKATRATPDRRARRLAYLVSAVLMVGLILAAVVQALGGGTPVEIARAAGVG